MTVQKSNGKNFIAAIENFIIVIDYTFSVHFAIKILGLYCQMKFNIQNILSHILFDKNFLTTIVKVNFHFEKLFRIKEYIVIFIE